MLIRFLFPIVETRRGIKKLQLLFLRVERRHSRIIFQHIFIDFTENLIPANSILMTQFYPITFNSLKSADYVFLFVKYDSPRNFNIFLTFKKQNIHFQGISG